MGKSVLPRGKPEELSLHQEKKRIERARKKIIESQDAFDDKGAAILELLDEKEMFWRRNMKDWIERNEVLHEDAGIAGAGGLRGLLGEYSNGGEVKKKPFLEKIFGPTLESKWDTFTEKQKEYVRKHHPNSVPEGKAQGGRIGLAGGMSPSEKWMRDYFFSERGEKYENRMSFKQFEMGIGKDLWYNHIGKAKGGRIGYRSGTAYPDPNRVAPSGDLATNMMNVFANKFAGRKTASPGSPVAKSNSFMGSLLPNLAGAHFASLQSSESHLQQAYESYVASGGGLGYEEWKTTRTRAAQGGRIGYGVGDFVKKKIKRYTKEGRKEDIGKWLKGKDVDLTAEEWRSKSLKEKLKLWAWKLQPFYTGELEKGKDYASGGIASFAGGGGTSIRKYTIPPEALSIVTEMYEKAGGRGQTGMSLKEFAFAYFNKKKGGRVGFRDGEGVMSRTGNVVDVGNIPYYAGKGLQGLVHSAETLSKFPLAAGELGSKLLRQKPSKEMFSEAIENITPGSWSENLGLTSLIEGMEKERSPEAITAGGILGLGTEIAVPTGGAFKAGQLLLNKANKAMGKIKDGKNLNKLIDEKLTDFGQSRRDFNVMAGTSGLMIALKSIGLGGLFKAATKVKPSDDVVMTLKTWVDDSDVQTEWGPQATASWAGAFDVASLSKAAQKTLDKIMKKLKKAKAGSDDLENPWRNNPESDFYESIDTWDASYILEGLKKAGHKVKFEHVDDMSGRGMDEALASYKQTFGKTSDEYKKLLAKSKKMTEKERVGYHTSITDDYGSHYDEGVEDFFDTFYGVKKASGGRIGLEGGGPAYEDFEEFMEDMKGMNKQQSREEFLKNWEKYKKWKYGDKLSGGYLRREEVAGGGRLTRTIPPQRGPVPQGLSYLLYDDTMRTGSK